MARDHGRMIRGRPTTHAENCVFVAWLAAIGVETLLVFPLYGLIAGGFEAPLEYIGTYARFFPWLAGVVLLGSIPLVILASALARRFEPALARHPVLWTHLSGGLFWVGMLAAWLLLGGTFDLGDSGTRSLLLHSGITVLIAVEAFIWVYDPARS